MTDKDTLARARYIFTTGKMVKDFIFRNHSQHFTNSCEEGVFCDLSFSQLHTIHMVRSHGQLSMSELAEILGVSPPSASAMVDRLVEKGLINREHSQEDRRKVVIRLSPTAEKDIEGVDEVILRSFVDLVESIGPETSQKWCEVLAKVKSVLDDNAAAGKAALKSES
jgi:DNA-binding MarR family transcriptional regulator